MSTQFDDDVFTSHSSKDKSRHGGMREFANRLKQDGRRVWLDEWKIQPGDVIELKSSQAKDGMLAHPLFGLRQRGSGRPQSHPFLWRR